MASRIRIQCVNKTPRYDAHDRIRNVGVLNADGTRWKLTQPDAIRRTEDGEFSFYVQDPVGQVAEVIVAVSRYGHKYLKTAADDEQPDNLLSLPECP